MIAINIQQNDDGLFQMAVSGDRTQALGLLKVAQLKIEWEVVAWLNRNDVLDKDIGKTTCSWTQTNKLQPQGEFFETGCGGVFVTGDYSVDRKYCPRCGREIRVAEEEPKELGVKEKQCEAVVHHGPGHQSKTHCQRVGEHTKHEAVYGRYDQYIEWEGKEAFSPPDMG